MPKSQELPFLHPMEREQSKERSYIWGYIVAIFLMILVFVMVISVISAPESIILLGPLALFLGFTAYGLMDRRRWGIGLFFIYSISVVPLVILAFLFGLLMSGGNMGLFMYLLFLALVVFGPASLPYFSRCEKEFS